MGRTSKRRASLRRSRQPYLLSKGSALAGRACCGFWRRRYSPRSVVTVVVACAIALVLPACGGGSKAPAATSSPSAASGARSSAGTAPTSAVADKFVLSADEYAGQDCTNSSIALVAVSSMTYTVREIATIDRASAWPGWTMPDDPCHAVSQWSSDHSLWLFEGKPPGVSTSHVGYVDMRTGQMHDLTEQRQGSGFGSQVLDEINPRFISDNPRTTRFGKHTFLFVSGEEAFLTTLEHPTTTTEVADIVVFGNDSHPETLYRPGQAELASLSPDLSAEVVSSHGTWRVKRLDGTVTSPVSCPSYSNVIGWLDGARVLMATQGTGGHNLRLLTVSVDGRTAMCGPTLLPGNNRSPGDWVLSLDRRLVYFNAKDDAGNSVTYSMPSAGGEPEEVLPPVLNESVQLLTRTTLPTN